MSCLAYYGQVIARAFRGGLGRADLIAGILTLTMIPVGQEFPQTFASIGASSWVPLYVFLTVLVSLVFYGLLKAPVDMHREAFAQIGVLRLTIEDRERIQRALNELWRLRKIGVEFRNEAMTETRFPIWKSEFDAWHQEVLARAGEINENLAQWLHVLDQLTQGTVTRPKIGAPEYVKLLEFYSEVLHRLQVFLEKDLKWPKMGA